MKTIYRVPSLLAALALVLAMFFPAVIEAQVVPLVNTSTAKPSASASLLCYDFNRSLKSGNSGEAVRLLQYFLITGEMAAIDPSEYGTFGQSTTAAVAAFQQKYASEILARVTNRQATGFVGPATRAKLKAVYGCQTQISQSPTVAVPGNVNLAVTNVQIDSIGVTATFCNKGTSDLPTAPFRIRLNGINRDFEIIGAQRAGMCDTESLPYATWGLTFDPGVSFSAVTIIDPYNVYKKSSIQFPLTADETLNAPAILGAHLSVRTITPKTTGVQSTLCNLGTVDLTSFPVRITVNGTIKDLDVPAAYKSGKCVTTSWGYDTWGMTYATGTVYTVTLQVDPNNIIKETNEFDNSATVVGTP